MTTRRRPKTARAVHANKGIEAAYRRELDRLIGEMSNSFEYWLAAAYKANPPRMEVAQEESELAQDALPSDFLSKRIAELSRRWIKRFDDMAKDIAERFASKTERATSASFQSALKDAGWAVKFQMTPVMRDAVNAVIKENVALIKSIPRQYALEVEGIVMRGFSRGRDLKSITDDLQKRYGVTRRRAALIARDQSNKLTATVTQARRVELGLFEAEWVHSGGGKEPRHSHVQAGKNKLRFDVRKGAYIDGEYILPGELINCHPGESKINIAHGCMKLYRRWYAGELVSLVADDGVVLKATPNHPVLTGKGWKAAKDVELGDYLIKSSHHSVNLGEVDVQNPVPEFADFFDAASRLIGIDCAGASLFNFHGDAPDSDVDVVDVARLLPFCDEAGIDEELIEFLLSFADSAVNMLSANGAPDELVVASLLSADRRVRSFGALLSKLRTESLGALNVCGALTPNFDTLLNEAPADYCSRYSVFLGELKLAKSGNVGACNFLIGKLLAKLAFWAPGHKKAVCADSLGESLRRNSEICGNAGDQSPRGNHAVRVTDKFISEDFSGHVYNLETRSNWYVVSGIVTHNCRCTSKTILPFDDN